MNCSFCCQPLPEEDDEEEMPNLHMDDQQGKPFLHLHGGCIRTVIKGLEFGDRLIVN